MAESGGFEPPMPLRTCLISNQVHSATLSALRIRLGYCIDVEAGDLADLFETAELASIVLF